VATLVGLTPDEMRDVARTIAERLAGARAPVTVVAPSRGFSLSGVPGEALWDEAANAAFLETLERELPPEAGYELVDADVNAPRFADRVADHAIERFATSASRAATGRGTPVRP
jgi:uncharacterized protein (UPF0261 family)